jgi:methionine-rich copper-binding protein CopC
MKSPIRSLALGAAVLLTTAFAMHLRLVKSVPASGQVVTEKPVEIRLWFSQKPEVGLTSVRLLRADSTAIEIGKVVATEDTLSVRVPLEKALVPGTYIVSWRSVSKDGHAVRGSYNFNMVPGPPARKQTGQ